MWKGGRLKTHSYFVFRVCFTKAASGPHMTCVTNREMWFFSIYNFINGIENECSVYFMRLDEITCVQGGMAADRKSILKDI